MVISTDPNPTASKDGFLLVRGVYVRRGVDLPKVGEKAIVLNNVTRDEFPAVITSVDAAERRYDIKVDMRDVQ